MRVIRLIIFYTILFSLTFLLAAYLLTRSSALKHNPSELLSPLLSDDSTPREEVQSFSSDYTTGLQQAVEDALIGSQATYSVVVKDLKTNETFTYNPHHIYQTASLYKLWTMAVVFEEIEQGQLQKDQVLTSSVPQLNEAFNIAPEDAEKTEGEIQMTVAEALERMITVSENYPALLLIKTVGISEMAQFLKDEGFRDSNVGQPPKSTAPDIASFFDKLYNGKLANPQLTKDMLTLLKKQQINDRIPKYLPDSVTVAHKTGELGEVKHDAGIVYTEKGNYILVVLSESNNQQLAAERIANISDNIYTFFVRAR